jgi:hypothetical protein
MLTSAFWKFSRDGKLGQPSKLNPGGPTATSFGLHQQGLIWYTPQSSEQRATLFTRRRPDSEQRLSR